MEVECYSGCCGGITLKGLGECIDSSHLPTHESLKEWITTQIVVWGENNRAFLSATTIECQTTAIGVLTELGFIASELLRRPIEGNAITIWYLPLAGGD